MQGTKPIAGLIITAGLLLLAARQDAHAKTVNFKSTFSGSAVSAAFSFDGIGQASASIAAGEASPGGHVTIQGIHQDAPDGKSCTVPSGVANAGTEFTLVGDAGVVRDDSSGDLLYSHQVSTTTCVDFSSGVPPFPFVQNASSVITGGTGKNAGATGTSTSSATGVIFLPPEVGFGVFGTFSGTGTGTLMTP